MSTRNYFALAIIQIISAPLIAVATVWLTFRSDFRRISSTRNFDRMHDIYFEVYTALYKINKLLHEISIDVFFPNNFARVQYLQKEVALIDAEKLEATISLFSDEDLAKQLEEWSLAKTKFSSGISVLTDQNNPLSATDRPIITNETKESLKKADRHLEAIRISIRKNLSID